MFAYKLVSLVLKMEQETRNCLFKFGCIPMRILIIVFLVLFFQYETFRYVAIALCFIVSLTFITKYIRKDMVGGFGGDVWWHSNRLKHAMLYMITGFLLLFELEWAGYILSLDIFIGGYSYILKETEPNAPPDESYL